MIDLYRSGAPAREGAERYGVGVRSVKRLLHSRGVRRRDAVEVTVLLNDESCGVAVVEVGDLVGV